MSEFLLPNDSIKDSLEMFTEETGMLLTIALIILALWFLGFVIHIGGGLIHLLLIIGVIVLIIHLLRGRPTTVD